MAYSTPGLLTDESRWLAKLVRMQRMAIHNMQAANAYNTTQGYELTTSETLSLAAGTVHSISFSVIEGTLTVSFDDSSTFVTYTAGQSLNIEASTTFADVIVLEMSAGLSDKATVQVITA